jgi:hypothetical protein
MADKKYYRGQVKLLLDILPMVARHQAFALKGGTAINFFVRDVPRLSVDIDLTYLPVGEREKSLTAIHNSLIQLSQDIQSVFPS